MDQTVQKILVLQIFLAGFFQNWLNASNPLHHLVLDEVEPAFPKIDVNSLSEESHHFEVRLIGSVDDLPGLNLKELNDVSEDELCYFCLEFDLFKGLIQLKELQLGRHNLESILGLHFGKT